MRLVKDGSLCFGRREGPGDGDGFRGGEGQVDIADPGFGSFKHGLVLPVGEVSPIGSVATEDVFPFLRG
jgi:hypothetical protein